MKACYSILFTLLSFYCFSQPNTEIFLFDLEQGNLYLELTNYRNISNNEGYDNQPSFMGDNSILYAGTRNGQTDIAEYNIPNGNKIWHCDTEGSEYSPLWIPNQNAISAIRLEKDGTQKLYRYDSTDKKYDVLLEEVIVGYQTWSDNNILLASILEDDQLNLIRYDFGNKELKKIDGNVGRSLHRIPNSSSSTNHGINHSISYISKNTSPWQIISLNIDSGKKSFVAAMLPEVEDMCWLSPNVLLMGKGSKLYKFDVRTSIDWVEIAELKKYDITNITRLAVSPDGNKLALVGELANPTLEPKLENIKWIAGNWKGEAFGGQTEENWSEPSGGSMMATFKLIDKGQVAFYEIEIIREVENSLILQLKHFDNDLSGWETKDETVDFTLKEITANKVVFEGMTFEKVSDNEMNVYVDIHQNDGTTEIVKFNYKK